MPQREDRSRSRAWPPRASPPALIRGGKGSIQLVLLKRLLPRRMFDGILSRRFGLAGFKPAPSGK